MTICIIYILACTFPDLRRSIKLALQIFLINDKSGFEKTQAKIFDISKKTVVFVWFQTTWMNWFTSSHVNECFASILSHPKLDPAFTFASDCIRVMCIVFTLSLIIWRHFTAFSFVWCSKLFSVAVSVQFRFVWCVLFIIAYWEHPHENDDNALRWDRGCK